MRFAFGLDVPDSPLWLWQAEEVNTFFEALNLIRKLPWARRQEHRHDVGMLFSVRFLRQPHSVPRPATLSPLSSY